jgi:hypothetical protein
MTLTETREGLRPFVDAEIRFTDPRSAGAVLHTLDHNSSTFDLISRTVRIRNARAVADGLSFERNGFTLLKHASDIDFRNPEEVERRYYPEAVRMAKQLTGASDAVAFLPFVRSETRGEAVELGANAHVDFDGPSVRQWIRQLRPADAEALLKKRFVNINLWRPIRPVQSMPLAVCDASSVSRADLVRTVIGHKPGQDASEFAGYNLAYNADQRWYWYPDMQPDEVLAFRLYDSEEQRPHLTAHTAFQDPASRPGVPPRISLEIRTIAFLD